MERDVKGLIERLNAMHDEYPPLERLLREAAAALTSQGERIAELERENHRIQCELNDKIELWHMADESARKWEQRYIDLSRTAARTSP